MAALEGRMMFLKAHANNRATCYNRTQLCTEKKLPESSDKVLTLHTPINDNPS